MQDEQHRFLRKVSYDPQTDCWPWIGSKYRFGYGHFRRKINNKWIMYKAHRYSYEYYKSDIPAGALVCHTCDNPSCVNPEHLYTGNAKDNAHDRVIRGRNILNRNPRHNLLSLDIAKDIRQYHQQNPNVNLQGLVDKFNTSKAQISRILNNKIWQEVL